MFGPYIKLHDHDQLFSNLYNQLSKESHHCKSENLLSFPKLDDDAYVDEIGAFSALD